MYRFDAELWRWEANAGWYFVTVPAAISDEIKARAAGPRRGFGSVRVRVTIGASTWSTSVFPDSVRNAYLLPVKKAVRTRQRVDEGDPVTVALDVLQ